MLFKVLGHPEDLVSIREGHKLTRTVDTIHTQEMGTGDFEHLQATQLTFSTEEGKD